MIAITGATGQLGQHVIENLLKTVSASEIVAIVRNPAKATALKSAGLPAGLADMLANSDTGASKGGLFDDSRTLSKLIGRPTTSLAESINGIL